MDIVTDALTAFGLQAKDSAHFADILASASSNSNTNVSMLGESFKYVAPVAGALGISAKDTSFALGLMANAGIKGSAAGTALRSSLTNLANPSKNMRKEMEKLGISLTDSNGKVKSGKQLFDELRQKFSKLTDAQKAQSASIIFGKEAMSGMLSIINASDKDYNKLYSNLNNASGSAEKMANTMQNNLKGAITNLKSAFEELQISLAKAVIPMLSKVVKFVTKIVNAFNKLPQPVKSAIGIIVGAIALLSPVFLILGKLVKSVSTVIGAFKKLTGAAKIFKMLPALITPHTLIIVGAILAIGLIVYQVIKHWDNLKKAAQNLWKHISDVCKKISNFFKESINGWKIAWKGFSDFMGGVGMWVCDGLFGGLQKGWDKIKGFTSKMAEGIKDTFKNILGINSPSKVFSEYGGFIGEGLVEGIDGQEGAIDTKFGGLANKIKNLGNVKPQFGLDNLALSGISSGFNNSNKQMNFNPTINMNVTVADTGGKGTEQLTQEVNSMGQVALKNSMVDLFMKDAIRN